MKKLECHTDMKYGRVVLDDSPAFEALYDPRMRWNGWLCPYLDRENTNKLMAFMTQEAGQHEGSSFEWDGEVVVETHHDYDGEQTRHEPVYIAGCPRWTIGSHSWVWSEAVEGEEYPEFTPPSEPENRFR